MSNKFQVAHINEQGVDLIVVFLGSAFEQRSPDDQLEAVDALQACASAAGLKGTVVPVWKVGSGMRFIAPPNWHPFFKGQGVYQMLIANINRELTCG